jgi:hypothetical protein
MKAWNKTFVKKSNLALFYMNFSFIFYLEFDPESRSANPDPEFDPGFEPWDRTWV